MAATAKEPTASDVRMGELAISQLHPRSASEIADVLAGGSGDDRQIGRALKEAASEVGSEDDEAGQTSKTTKTKGGGPRSKMAKIAVRDEYLGQIQRFESPGGWADVIRRCELSLESAASGIRRGGNFCVLTGRQNSPPSEEAALARSAFFATGRTPLQRLPHSEKACVCLICCLEWKSKAAAQAGRWPDT